MSLLSARTQFCKLSGRHDLVTNFAGGTYTDNGANWFINRGIDELDLMMITPKSMRDYKVNLAANAYIVTPQRVIAVHEVWIADNDGRWQLEEKDESWMRDKYPTPYSELTSGLPLYYAHFKSELSPDLKALRSTTYTTQYTYDHEDVLYHEGEGDASPHYKKTRLIVMPPTDVLRTVSVKGRFFSEELSTDTDENYWTYVHEDLVTLAAMMIMERTFRNYSGAEEYRNEIVKKLNLLDMGLVEEECNNVTQMEG